MAKNVVLVTIAGLLLVPSEMVLAQTGLLGRTPTTGANPANGALITIPAVGVLNRPIAVPVAPIPDLRTVQQGTVTTPALGAATLTMPALTGVTQGVTSTALGNTAGIIQGVTGVTQGVAGVTQGIAGVTQGVAGVTQGVSGMAQGLTATVSGTVSSAPTMVQIPLVHDNSPTASPRTAQEVSLSVNQQRKPLHQVPTCN